MKKSFAFLMIVLSSILLAQDLETEPVFSKFYFSLLGGINFNTIPTAGSAITFAVKSNVTSNIDAKFSVGYSVLFDNDSYEVKYYRFYEFNQQYHTHLLAVDKVKYTIVPISIGAEYTFLNNNISPFALIEAGYNYSSSKTEGQLHDGIAGRYDNVEDIPAEYRKLAPALDDGSSVAIGIGVGVKYLITERMDLNVRYVYHYNESIINNNQVLIGFTF